MRISPFVAEGDLDARVAVPLKESDHVVECGAIVVTSDEYPVLRLQTTTDHLIVGGEERANLRRPPRVGYLRDSHDAL